MNLLEISEARRQAALRVIRESGVVEAWESVGATVNLVGSVRSGLIMKNLDIDFHIYTDEPATSRDESVFAHAIPGSKGKMQAKRNQLMLDKSFAAIGRLEQNPAIKDILFKNFLYTEQECFEWHAWYEDTEGMGSTEGVDTGTSGPEKTGVIWQLDMIHIRRGSAFDGMIERTTDAVMARLDPAIPGADRAREAILRIKYDAPDSVKTPGIEVYYAVLERGLRTYDEFAAWRQANPNIDLLGWMP